VSGSTIGIKTADGEYYPILQEGDTHKKRLVLTTVRDEQTSVQIDVYRGADETLEHAEYVGSLMIENVEPAPAGEVEIEMLLQLDAEGNLRASASDSSTGQRQSLAVELAALGQGETYDIPDFQLDEDLEGFEEDEGEEGADPFATEAWDEELPEEPHRRPEFEPLRPSEAEPQRRGPRPVAVVGFVILGLVVILLITALILWLFRGDDVPALFARRDASDTVAQVEPEPGPPSAEAEQESAEPEPASEPQAAEPQAEAESVAEADQAEDAQVPEPARQEAAPTRVETGLWYRIRWGDTLWDLSSSFYRTPCLYGKIARANDIENPDLIYAGSSIFIPKD
jgi:hypothetical protein